MFKVIKADEKDIKVEIGSNVEEITEQVSIYNKCREGMFCILCSINIFGCKCKNKVPFVPKKKHTQPHLMIFSMLSKILEL